MQRFRDLIVLPWLKEIYDAFVRLLPGRYSSQSDRDLSYIPGWNKHWQGRSVFVSDRREEGGPEGRFLVYG